MTKEIIFASGNAGKLKEVQAMLPQYTVLGLKDIGWEADIPETGDTLKANALIKAETIFKAKQLPVFADDTGLEVNALGGGPGVYSARYAGPDCNPDDNMDLLLKELEGNSDRSAQFKTVICYFDGNPTYFEGVVEGVIASARLGDEGFGYDPIFIPTEKDGRSFAQMPVAEKNEISHRGRALQKLKAFLG